MTREEAIATLQANYPDACYEQLRDAVDTAISLLKQPEIIRCKDCKHHFTYRCMDSIPTEICDLNQTFYDPNMDFCSLAERRGGEVSDGKIYKCG